MPTTQCRRCTQEACMAVNIKLSCHFNCILEIIWPVVTLLDLSDGIVSACIARKISGVAFQIPKPSISRFLLSPITNRFLLSPITSMLNHLFFYQYRTGNLSDHRIRSFCKIFAKLAFRFWKTLPNISGFWNILKYFYILQNPSFQHFPYFPRKSTQIPTRIEDLDTWKRE